MDEENNKIIKQMEEEKADIIKDSERKIAESVLINNIKLVELWNSEDIVRFVKENTNITIAKLLNEYKIIKKL